MKPGKLVSLLALALCLGLLLSLAPATSGAFAQSVTRTTATGAVHVASPVIKTQLASPALQNGVNYLPPRYYSRFNRRVTRYYPRFNRRVIVTRRYYPRFNRRIIVYPRFNRRVIVYPRFNRRVIIARRYYPRFNRRVIVTRRYYPRFNRRIIVAPRFNRGFRR